MCVRWHQLGAFYPFYRDHNMDLSPDQDPGVFGDPYVSIIRSVTRLRYYLLPYLYTLFYEHSTLGSSVARPLWHQFPQDNKTYDIDTQFMLGSSLLLCPVLSYQEAETRCCLPEGVWYSAAPLLASLSL